jgi:hypothetical protein
MIRELIDTDLEAVAGGHSFNVTSISIPTVTQNLLQNNSNTQTGVSIFGGDVTNFQAGQSNSAAQVASV